MDTAINIYVNNKILQLPLHASVNDLLDSINIRSGNGIALAVNNQVIPKNEWGTYTFKPEDKVTIIKATQGG